MTSEAASQSRITTRVASQRTMTTEATSRGLMTKSATPQGTKTTIYSTSTAADQTYPVTIEMTEVMIPGEAPSLVAVLIPVLVVTNVVSFFVILFLLGKRKRKQRGPTPDSAVHLQQTTVGGQQTTGGSDRQCHAGNLPPGVAPQPSSASTDTTSESSDSSKSPAPLRHTDAGNLTSQHSPRDTGRQDYICMRGPETTLYENAFLRSQRMVVGSGPDTVAATDLEGGERPQSDANVPIHNAMKIANLDYEPPPKGKKDCEEHLEALAPGQTELYINVAPQTTPDVKLREKKGFLGLIAGGLYDTPPTARRTRKAVLPTTADPAVPGTPIPDVHHPEAVGTGSPSSEVYSTVHVYKTIDSENPNHSTKPEPEKVQRPHRTAQRISARQKQPVPCPDVEDSHEYIDMKGGTSKTLRIEDTHTPTHDSGPYLEITPVMAGKSTGGYGGCCHEGLKEVSSGPRVESKTSSFDASAARVSAVDNTYTEITSVSSSAFIENPYAEIPKLPIRFLPGKTTAPYIQKI